MSLLIVVDRVEDFRWARPSDRIVAAEDYFRGDAETQARNAKVVNLCRGHEHLSTAHFCSMIAEAREQVVVPSTASLLRHAQRELWADRIRELNQVLMTRIDPLDHGTETVLLLFGESSEPELTGIGRKIYRAFPFPLLRATIAFAPSSTVVQLVPLTLGELEDHHEKSFLEALDRFAESSGLPPAPPTLGRLRLAILHDPSESLPPSRMPTLHKFVQVGAEMDIDVQLIRHRDLGRIGEFDALFIRRTTSVEHYTYRFAEKAERLGIPVIDDPASIRRMHQQGLSCGVAPGQRHPASENLDGLSGKPLRYSTCAAVSRRSQEAGRCIQRRRGTGGYASRVPGHRDSDAGKLETDHRAGIRRVRFRLAHRHPRRPASFRGPLLHVRAPLADSEARAGCSYRRKDPGYRTR